MSPACRPYNAFIKSSFQKDYSYINIDRRFQCSLSPVSTLWDCESHDGSPPIRIGNVQLKYDCVTMTANIYTPEMSQPKFIIRANRCKPQNLCPMHCNGCDEYEFEIYDTRVDAEVGKVTKIFTDYCQEYFSGGCQWVIDFPYKSSYKSKALIVEAIQLLDLSYFDWPRFCLCGCW